jgi:hypothetical protein
MVSVHPDLVTMIAKRTGAVWLHVTGAADDAAVERGFRRAREMLTSMAHPEEPSEPLPSATWLKVGPLDSPRLGFDIADADAYPDLLERVVGVITEALNMAGADGVLTYGE